MKWLCTCLTLVAITSARVYAQPTFQFEHISTEQGLSQRAVLSICQDREGFMWFGTLDGLNKYDGYQFTVFKPDPLKPTRTLRHNIVRDIHEDRKGRLWVATFGGGLHQVNKRTGEVTAYPIKPTSKTAWNVLSSIYEDSQGMLWTAAEGIARFNPDTRQYTLYPSSDLMNMVQGDPNGRIWAVVSSGSWVTGKVNRLDPATGQYHSFALPPKSRLGFIDTQGFLWIGTDGEGLFRADTKDDSLRFTSYQLKGVTEKPVFRRIYEDSAGFVCVMTNAGLLRINSRNSEVVSIDTSSWIVNGLSKMPMNAMLFDRAGHVWIGNHDGIEKVTAHPKAFETYQIKASPASVRLPDNRVTSLLADRTGALWLASTGGMMVGAAKGFYRSDGIGKPLKKIWIHPADTNNLTANLVKSLYEDRHGRIWAGTGEGLRLYNRTTGQFTLYPTQLPVLFNMAEDASGKLWVSVARHGNLGGVACFNSSDQKFTYYIYKPGETKGLKDGSVYHLMVSRTNEIWFATSGGGVARLNQRTGTFTYYEASPTFEAGHLNDKDTRALYEDADGLIWVGTNQGGLHRLDPKTGTFTVFTTLDGLPSNHIASIQGDTRGNLWIGTNNGLCRFNPKTQAFHNFGIHDGLPDKEFTHAASQTFRGNLLFGTLNGYVVFNPEAIRENTIVPPVYITGLKVLDKPRAIPSDHLALPYTENYLSLEFVGLNYNAPEKNQYAYQLEGVDKDWIYSGTRRFTSYTELSPGDYVFRVKASNNDGVWNETGTTLYITIHPPWWQTWWAYSLYVIGFVAGLWSFIRYRSRALRRENRLLEQKVTIRTEQIQHQKEEIAAQRDNLEQTLTELKATQQQLIQKEKMASLGELTAGIAHEIQNPLNFVNNFAEVSVAMTEELEESVQNRDLAGISELSAELRENMSYIVENGKRAAAIVRSMLEHSRSSTGERRPTNLNELANEYLNLAYHGMQAADPDFRVQLCTRFDEELQPVTVAPQEIGRVLLNLYNNAFYAVKEKHKQAGAASYQARIEVTTHVGNGRVELRVKDNGTGISPEIVSRIYQPFFTTKPTGQGTGLGLSLSYDIVTKGHGGEIRVASQPGEFTEFVVSVPKV
ncbi:sensor histidine kinase [Nibrella saemangeumensis]|uniref:histidine kinase n=1 Tax=Nibrella saemangeumensis TaxID=1084526 RepID=A0ABP8MU32_9BACT